MNNAGAAILTTREAGLCGDGRCHALHGRLRGVTRRSGVNGDERVPRPDFRYSAIASGCRIDRPGRWFERSAHERSDGQLLRARGGVRGGPLAPHRFGHHERRWRRLRHVPADVGRNAELCRVGGRQLGRGPGFVVTYGSSGAHRPVRRSGAKCASGRADRSMGHPRAVGVGDRSVDHAARTCGARPARTGHSRSGTLVVVLRQLLVEDKEVTARTLLEVW